METREKILYTVFGTVAVLPVAVLISNGDYDALRWLVLSQSVIVFVLYTTSLLLNLSRLAFNRTAIWRLRVGAALRHVAILVFLTEGMIGVFNRLGHADFNPLTPVLQLLLIFLVTGWGLTDSIDFSTKRKSIEDNIIKAMRDHDDG